MPTPIASRDIYLLLYDAHFKSVYLAKNDCATPLMKAKFFYDNSDGAAILSGFQGDAGLVGLAKLIADMVSEYLSANQDKCKLFCYAGDYENEFVDNRNYRSASIDRLMLRETNKMPAAEIVLPETITFQHLDPKTVDKETIKQMTSILNHHTYWAADVDDAYTINAINNSDCIIAVDKYNKIVGLARFISNQEIAYISDIVVDAAWRRKQVGTIFLQYICKLIDEQHHKFTALIYAREGDGHAAASKLYSEKFGFKDYSKEHQHTIYFRYVRMTPENRGKYQQLCAFEVAHADAKSASSLHNFFQAQQSEESMLIGVNEFPSKGMKVD